jgi:hydroxyacylglutathione hydrolase
MFERFFDEGLGRTSYLVACPRAREAVVIDPRRDVEIYVSAARERDVTIRWVFQTHVHDDFACGARELVALGAKAIVGPDAGLRFQHHYVTHGERMRIGDLSILFLHTPGHTREHIAILASQPDEPVRLFTGDTLGAGGVGRPEAATAEGRRALAWALHESLCQRILPLDDRIHLLPSSGAQAATTIGHEKRTNPMLRFEGRDGFVQAVLDEPVLPTPFGDWVRTVNQAGPPLLAMVNGFRGLPAISPGSAATAIRAGGAVLDLRAPDDFAAGHARDACNVAVGPALGPSVRRALPRDPRIVLVAQDGAQAREAALQLLRLGVSRIDGYINGGFAAWRAAGLPTTSSVLSV